MKRFAITLIILTIGAIPGSAQVSGNIAYSQTGGSARAMQNERAKRTIARDDIPVSGTMFVDANILMNVKADEYVAVFAISQEAPTVAECGQKMDAVINQFASELRALGLAQSDYLVDFVAQSKIYSYEVTGEIAKEKLSGFELKKNVSVHYRDKALLDRLVLAAARAQVFDLIKVDYIVRDISSVHNRLMTEASRIIKQKAARYGRVLGIKLQGPTQVYAERPSIYYPGDMYDSYAAFESEDVSAGSYRQKYIIQGARKARTFYFNPLSAASFDYVINPVVIEPVVQFTLFLKVKYENPKGPATRTMNVQAAPAGKQPRKTR